MLSLATFFLAGCDKAGAPGSKAATPVVKAAATPVVATTGTVDASTLHLSEQEIEALKAKFTFDEASGWYTHRHWGKNWPTRKTLTADVYKNGYFNLCSNYYGDHPMDHQSIELLIDGQTFASESVAPGSDAHRSKQVNGKHLEINYYRDLQGRKLLEKVALNESGEISLRFLSPNKKLESSLLKSDQDALRDCYLLAMILHQTH